VRVVGVLKRSESMRRTIMTSTSMRVAAASALGLVLAATVVAVQTSHATTRGTNGRIVYSAEVNGHYQVFTIAPNGTDTRQLTSFADGSDAVNPDWSPDGMRIAFERDLPYPHVGVVTIDAGGGDPQTVTPDTRLLFDGDPAYAPGGKLIASAREVHFDDAATTPRDHGEIVVEQLDGSGVREVTPRLRLTATDEPHYADPNFSPDGRWITFLRVNRNEVSQALFRVRADGTGLRRLTPYAWDVATKHDWSPDGKLIVITTNADLANVDQSANLVVIRPDGSGVKQLTHFKAGGRRAYAGSFSPDGTKIAFRLEQGNRYAIAVIGRNGKNMRVITKLSSTKPRFIDWGTHP
jgi:dipeptidyl aminopeptidase/acylaminoacyl peptidase